MRAFPYTIILGSILFLLKITWIRWGDVIIDLGAELYLPLKISKGLVLYKDINYFFGPLPIYLHSFLFKIFSPKIDILITCGIFTTCLTAIFIYKISRLFDTALKSLLPTLTFIFVCAFGNYVYINNYNFILPYTYTATYGILFSLISIFFFIMFVNNRRLINLVIYLIFSTFTLLCKFETGIALIIASAAGILFHPAYKKKMIFIIASLSPIVLLITAYWITGLSMTADKNTLYQILHYNKLFAKTISGTNELYKNISLVIYSSLLYTIAIVCFLSFDFILKNLKNNFITFSLYLAAIIMVILVAILMNPYIQYRVLPIILIVTIFLSLYKLFKKQDIETYAGILTISLFSFLLSVRIILNISAAHYGFYILVPGLISYYIFFLKIIPELYGRFTRHGLYYHANTALFILLILNHFTLYHPIYKNRTLRIEGRRGAFNYLNNVIGVRYKELINYLINTANSGETLIVFPEGVDINFHTGLDNPIFYYSFLPQELEKDGKQEEIISQIDKAKVDYIVVIQRDTTEYGPPSFGVDYGKELFHWIKENYELIKTFGPMPFTTSEFGIAVMRRK